MTLRALLKARTPELAAAFVFVAAANLLALAVPASVGWIVDRAASGRTPETLVPFCAAVAAVILARALASYAGQTLALDAAEKAVADLRQRVHEHLLRASLLDLETKPAGVWTARLSGDAEAVRRFFFSGVLDLAYAVFTALFVTAALFFLHPLLAAVTAAAIPLAAAVCSSWSGRLKDDYRMLRDEQERMNAYGIDLVRGMRTVRAFGREDRERALFAGRAAAWAQAARRTRRGDAWFWTAAEAASALGLLFILAYGARETARGALTVGGLTAFYAYAGFLFLPLLKSAAVHGAFRDASAALRRIEEVLAVPVIARPAVSAYRPFRGKLECRNVSHTYTAGRTALRAVDWTVPEGRWVALTGPSGSGKSTLIALFLRFFDPSSGIVLADGIDLRAWDADAWRSRIGWASRGDYWFDGTVSENLSYGRRASRTALNEACALSGAAEVIERLPFGYETRLGAGAPSLSTGERQRLSLARALANDPRCLFLDEATSALDERMENDILTRLKKWQKGRTIVMAAHRAAAWTFADETVRLHSGRLERAGHGAAHVA